MEEKLTEKEVERRLLYLTRAAGVGWAAGPHISSFSDYGERPRIPRPLDDLRLPLKSAGSYRMLRSPPWCNRLGSLALYSAAAAGDADAIPPTLDSPHLAAALANVADMAGRPRLAEQLAARWRRGDGDVAEQVQPNRRAGRWIVPGESKPAAFCFESSFHDKNRFEEWEALMAASPLSVSPGYLALAGIT